MNYNIKNFNLLKTMEGLLVFYKKRGQSSYDVIRDLKKRFKIKKIGHGGTLDPLAEGILVIGIGKKGTKQLTNFLKGVEKEYLATIILGVVSKTYDAEGPLFKINTNNLKYPSKKIIFDTLKQFQGESLQSPPPFSAIKISGQPAYKLARAGKEVKIKAKKVFVSKIELLDYSLPQLRIKLKVQSGFYVRSFVNDLGKILKTGAYLKKLIRTKVGCFDIEEAIKLADLEKDFLELYFKAKDQTQKRFFRFFVQKLANSLKLVGKIENSPNKREIKIIAQGKSKNLQMFLEKVKENLKESQVNEIFYYFRAPQTKNQNFIIS